MHRYRLYTAEISETSIRGILGSFMQVFMNIGWLYSYCIGPFTSYTTFWLACSILQIIFFVVFYFMPESPVYLSARGKHEEVIKVLAKLRGKNLDSVKTEADEISVCFNFYQINIETTFNKSYWKFILKKFFFQENVQANANIDTNMLDLFRVKSNFEALLFCCTLFTFQSFSGTLVVLNYAQIIFDAAGGTNDLFHQQYQQLLSVLSSLFFAALPLFLLTTGEEKFC